MWVKWVLSGKLNLPVGYLLKWTSDGGAVPRHCASVNVRQKWDRGWCWKTTSTTQTSLDPNIFAVWFEFVVAQSQWVQETSFFPSSCFGADLPRCVWKTSKHPMRSLTIGTLLLLMDENSCTYVTCGQWRTSGLRHPIFRRRSQPTAADSAPLLQLHSRVKVMVTTNGFARMWGHAPMKVPRRPDTQSNGMQLCKIETCWV